MSANVEQLLAQKKLEMLSVQGAAPNVVIADSMAWAALEQVLGPDPVDQWVLKAMNHSFNAVGPKVEFVAEFVRRPDEEES